MIDAGIVPSPAEPRLRITDSEVVWADHADLEMLNSLDATSDLLPNVQAWRIDNFQEFMEFRAVVPCVTTLARSEKGH